MLHVCVAASSCSQCALCSFGKSASNTSCLVSLLLLQDHGYLIIRGAPETGKTSALQLLARHIQMCRPDATLVYLPALRLNLGGGEDFCMALERLSDTTWQAISGNVGQFLTYSFYIAVICSHNMLPQQGMSKTPEQKWMPNVSVTTYDMKLELRQLSVIHTHCSHIMTQRVKMSWAKSKASDCHTQLGVMQLYSIPDFWPRQLALVAALRSELCV